MFKTWEDIRKAIDEVDGEFSKFFNFKSKKNKNKKQKKKKKKITSPQK